MDRLKATPALPSASVVQVINSRVVFNISLTIKRTALNYNRVKIGKNMAYL